MILSDTKHSATLRCEIYSALHIQLETRGGHSMRPPSTVCPTTESN